MVNVEPVAGVVIVTLLIVLLVNASFSANVANVPVIGKVTLVAAVVVSVVAKAPLNANDAPVAPLDADEIDPTEIVKVQA
jgi:hypothetical protein